MAPAVLRPGQKRDITKTYHDEKEYAKWYEEFTSKAKAKENAAQARIEKSRSFLTDAQLNRRKSRIERRSTKGLVIRKSA
jgi:hypothetical protein